MYNTIKDVHDQFNTKSSDPIFIFTSQALVAFRKSQIDDVATKLYIDNNADNAKDYAYNSTPVIEEEPKKFPLNIFGILTLSATIICVLIFMSAIFNNLNNKTEQSTNQTKENIYNSKKKRTSYDNRIRFYYSLKRITKKGKVNTKLNETQLAPYSNPYPKTFNLIKSGTNSNSTTNTKIVNQTNSGLILFKMIKGKDESIYIPKQETRFISLNTSDSLLFYKGNNFIDSKFSHFKNDTAISEIYEVKKINDSTDIIIRIIPNTLEIETPEKTISKENLHISENIKLKKISINNLYRAYYDAYMN